MHYSLRLSRGLRDDGRDVVSNSQLKVDVSTSDPIMHGLPVSPRSSSTLFPRPTLDCPSSPLRLLAEYKFQQIMRD